ncbi:hypothetical protein K8S17_06970 [bacterium]|nr:hypothetical protein [bacterium]
MKTVVVCGDLICDHNLVQDPIARPYHHALPRAAVLHRSSGGAWFLQRMIELAISGAADFDVTGVCAVPRGDGDSNLSAEGVSHAFQVWSGHKKHQDSKPEETVWRISQFLGCHRPDAVPSSSAHLCLSPDDPRSPDVLVIDDLCLRFREWECLWPAALRDGGDPVSIVLKTSSAGFDSPLWCRLVDAGWLDRLTIVLSADSLRERGGAITRGLSWDRTIEETVAEINEGVSSYHLGRCRRVVIHFGGSGVASFTRCDLSFGSDANSPFGGDSSADATARAPLADSARLERFLYDPEHHEGVRKTGWPGRMFGALSIMAAAVVRYEVSPGDYPLYTAMGRALSAMRANHRMGAGDGSKGFEADASEEKIKSILSWSPPADGKEEDPAFAFFTAYPRYVAEFPYGLPGYVKGKGEGKGTTSDLLRDLTGEGTEYVAAKATEIVLRGAERALAAAPKAKYGRYLTADREEIERINAIHNLVMSYRNNPKDRNPLSIAVFGPPGSGKSFAIKQLLATIFGGKKPLEFNLSQFDSPDDLRGAFHQVRDRTIQGDMPLVLWDEFDADGLKWLKHFLAPMNDAEFRSGSLTHPLGRCVFVFAGATKHCFEDFSCQPKDEEDCKKFISVKAPDFVSRLRGFVNDKGPNPPDVVSSESGSASPEGAVTCSDRPQLADAHLIRRALLLRSGLERLHPALIDPGTKLAAISPSVIAGFLRVEKFKHGARSLMAIISMSSLSRDKVLGVASLPPEDLLNLHVTGDFMDHVRKGQISAEVTEFLAEACHEAWRAAKEAKGWEYAEVRCDADDKHDRLMPYHKLRESWKEDNRKSARLVRAKLLDVGYDIKGHCDPDDAEPANRKVIGSVLTDLMKIEHDIWLRDRLIQGWSYAAETKDDVRLHQDVAPFGDGLGIDQELDRVIVESIPGPLARRGYKLVRDS